MFKYGLLVDGVWSVRLDWNLWICFYAMKGSNILHGWFHGKFTTYMESDFDFFRSYIKFCRNKEAGELIKFAGQVITIRRSVRIFRNTRSHKPRLLGVFDYDLGYSFSFMFEISRKELCRIRILDEYLEGSLSDPQHRGVIKNGSVPTLIFEVFIICFY